MVAEQVVIKQELTVALLLFAEHHSKSGLEKEVLVGRNKQNEALFLALINDIIDILDIVRGFIVTYLPTYLKICMETF